MSEEKPKRGRGRPRKATPVPTKEGHSARVWVKREGEEVRTWVKLHTKSPVVATARKNRLLRGEELVLVAEKSESFESAARSIVEASGVKDAARILGRLHNHAFPIIGRLPVSEVTSVQILEVLGEVEKAVGGWTGQVRNVRDAISMVLGTLVERRVLDVNEALRIKFRRKRGAGGGRRIEKVVPPRAVLTDEEFQRLVAWLAERAEAGSSEWFELLVLCLVARAFGMRMSDCHAWRWEMVDTAGFADAYVPRPKTDGDLLDEGGAAVEGWRDEPRSELPKAVGDWLRLWWERAGSPGEGPVFPVRRGKRAGEHKTNANYPIAIRKALWLAGVVRARPGVVAVKSPSDCALQSGIPRRMSRVEFHSFRRASATAAGKAVVTGELSLRQAMAITHHADPAVFARYQAREERIVVPESSFPAIVAAPRPLFGESSRGREAKEAAPCDSAPRDGGGRATPGGPSDVVSPERFAGAIHPESPRETPRGHYSRPLSEGLAALTAQAMLEGDHELALKLVELSRSRAQSAPDNVTRLDPSRRKR